MTRPRSNVRKRPTAAAPPGALIQLDTRKIREEALESYRKAERELAKASEQLKRFHERDTPGFRAWCHRTFGKLFVQLRDLQAALNEKQNMAREISDIAARYDLQEAEAYREYLWRKAHPEAAEEKDRLRNEELQRLAEEAQRAKTPGEAEEELFGENLEDDWDELEDIFKAFMGMPRQRRVKKVDPDPKTARELYRMIVRNLHPDHHGHMSETSKHLWDEAQTAWREHDVEALKGILAQCEGGDIGIGPRSAVSTILQMTKRIKDALRRSRSEIRRLSKKLEWNYETRKSNPAYARKVETVILDDIRLVRFQLERLNRILSNLEHKAHAKKYRQPKPQPTRVR
jgi:hypothetical protein